MFSQQNAHFLQQENKFPDEYNCKKNIGQTLQLNAARDQGLSLQTCCEEKKYIYSWVYLSKREVWENRSISMIDNCKSCASLVRAKIFAHHWSEWKYCVSRKIASLGTSLHRCASPMQEGKNASPEKSYTNQFEISATERWYNLRPIMKEDIYIYMHQCASPMQGEKCIPRKLHVEKSNSTNQFEISAS